MKPKKKILKKLDEELQKDEDKKSGQISQVNLLSSCHETQQERQQLQNLNDDKADNFD